jgi:hypothetical protein
LQTLQTSPVTLNSIAWGLTPPLQTYNFTPPSLPAGQSLALEFEARADRDPDGSNFYLNVYVNGQSVTVAADRLNTRLLNKPALIPIDTPGLFWGDSKSWRLMWARNFTDDFSYGSESYRFVVDISDLVRSGQNNTVSFQHNNSGNSIPIVLQNVRVGSVPSPKRRTPYTIAGKPITPTANVRSDGGLKVAIGKTTLPITSFFSVPGGGWKRLGPATGTARSREATGSVTSSVKGGVTTVKMNLPAYNLSRTVSIINGSIKVKDTLTNKTAADIGMKIAHEATFPALWEPCYWRAKPTHRFAKFALRCARP